MVNKKQYFSRIAMCLMLSTAYSSSAYSYDDNEVESVKERHDAFYTPEGIRLGVFTLSPSLEVLQKYDDNIFRQQSGEKSDAITLFQPSVALKSDWGLHEVQLGASGDFGRFSDFDSENYEDHRLYASGRYDIDYETYLTVSASLNRLHEDRSSLDDVGGDSPTEFDRRSMAVTFSRSLGILKLRLGGELHSYEYEDSSSGGASIDNSNRDRDHQALNARLSYGVSDDYDVFVQAETSRRRYDESTGAARDSDGREYQLGMAVNFSGKAKGDVYIGRLTQDYRTTFDDVSATTYGASVLWNPTEVMSLDFNIDREVLETTLAGASGLLRTDSSVVLEHSFRDNVFVDLGLGLIDEQYEGTAVSSRDNTTYVLGAGAEYRVNNRLHAGVNYEFKDRSFKDNVGDYDNHVMTFSVKYAY